MAHGVLCARSITHLKTRWNSLYVTTGSPGHHQFTLTNAATSRSLCASPRLCPSSAPAGSLVTLAGVSHPSFSGNAQDCLLWVPHIHLDSFLHFSFLYFPRTSKMMVGGALMCTVESYLIQGLSSQVRAHREKSIWSKILLESLLSGPELLQILVSLDRDRMK